MFMFASKGNPKDVNMLLVDIGNTRILTNYVQNSPLTLLVKKENLVGSLARVCARVCGVVVVVVVLKKLN